MDKFLVLAQDGATNATTIQLVGAALFGALIGWYVYYINRYRTGAVQFSDLVTVIGIIGGGTILALFDPDTDLFGAYGIGLALGFWGYFMVLVVLVAISDNFDSDWFLDGRRKEPAEGYEIPGYVRPTAGAMDDKPETGDEQTP